ncbi:MAG: hypothetical protein IKE55_04740 [Kiritimatiellae bacterium]|nr:hypothetical protein [Kiritimatiellia bacterium]
MADKGVIVEFDFTAMNGAELLFETTKKFLADLDGIPFDATAEARYLAGGNYQGGLAELFSVVKTKKTAQKAARDLAAAFNAALTAAVPSAVTPSFRNFVKVLADKGVKVVIATRADVVAVRMAFAQILSGDVVLYQETSTCYGAVKWDAWRRACVANRLRHLSAVAVTGSGFGVKSALIAGMGSMAVVNEHVAYQDFGGADEVVDELSGPTARKLLGVLRI